MKYLAIDPSVNNVGFAIMQDNEWEWGVWNPPRAGGLPETCDWLAERVLEVEPDELILEYPIFMIAQRGIIAAQKGYTIDLGAICGWIAGASRLPSGDIYFYTPNQWKGQLKKQMVEFRFLRKFGTEHKGTPDHAFEAAMLLDYHVKRYQ